MDIPKGIFLAGFDQLMLGHEKKESLYLQPENKRAIFNLAGIVLPALMVNGQVAGKWKKKKRKLSIELFTSVEPNDIAAIKEKAASLWDDISQIDFI